MAKDVFQVHGISENGRVILNKAIKRAKLLAFFETLPPCVIGMEACGSSHHWGRTLRKLGHDVRLTPANPMSRMAGSTDPNRSGATSKAR